MSAASPSRRAPSAMHDYPQATFSAETRDALVRELRDFSAQGGAARDFPRRIRELLARLALDEMYQFVAVLSPDGTLLEVNQPALVAGGLDPRDVLGRPYWEARWWSASPETRARAADAARRAASGEFVRFEVDLLAGQGGRELVTVDFSVRPVRAEGGAAAFLVAEGRNITARRRAEAELARRNEELRALYERLTELDRLKTELFANVSHELRTPLALVLGPIERLLDARNLDDDQRRALQVAVRNGRTLLKHVNDLLEVARLEGGAVRLERCELDLARLVGVAAGHFDDVARERRIAFTVEAAGPVRAEVDQDKLDRVVLNLVSNAIKFTPDGGRVRISLAAAGGVARLEVADSGPGIPPERRASVFERFRQLETGGARPSAGIGLGLAIVKDLVELHGGRILVGAAPEGGALFAVELPLAAPAGAEVRRGAPVPELGERRAAEVAALGVHPLAPAPPSPPDARPLVLVVEDHPQMSEFVRGALSTEFRTAGARDGAEGLRLARELRPDLVVTDVMMPDTPGDDLVRRLRLDPELAGVPILVLTAKADDALRSRLLSEGALDWVAKPVAVPELRARVRNLVAMKRARDVLQAELADQAEDVDRLAGELARRRRELQTALDSMRFAREQADRASGQKTTLMRLVSHELRTPISALVLQVERMRRDANQLSPYHRDAVGRMRSATHRLAGLVESLLEYSRIESGRMTLEPESVDAASVAAEVVDELRPQAAQKGLTITSPQAGAAPTLETDPRLLRLVLLNLVSNGIKFTDAGSVAVTVEAAGGTHRIAVHDTGRGVAKEDQVRIFEPFEQLETIARKHTPGVGLGLALVREMVGALGGRITVASEPGQGSTFAVILPSTRGEREARAAETPH